MGNDALVFFCGRDAKKSCEMGNFWGKELGPIFARKKITTEMIRDEWSTLIVFRIYCSNRKNQGPPISLKPNSQKTLAFPWRAGCEVFCKQGVTIL